MPNFTARDMLARLPVRMADGGDAAGVSAAYRRAMETGGQQTVDDYYANLRRDAAAYLANPNAPTGVDAYNVLLQSGISTSDLINAGVGQAVLDKIFTVQQPAGQTTATGQVIPAAAPAMQFTTPAGMTSAYERSPDLINEARRLSALGQDGRAALNTQGRQYVEALQQGGIDPAERAQMLEYATERGYTFDDLINAGVDPSVLFTKVTPKPRPYVAPTGGPTGGFTGAPSVYQPLPTQPDIYAAGQPALDVDFRASAPRTAIPGMPGQFDYTPAAKLRPATGAGLTWTPPSVTTRPRSLLSPKDIQAYGGTISASQRFAQDRALIDRNLRDLLSSTPALRNSSTYNKLRNEVMSGRFGADPSRVFSPQTAEGQEFQKYFANLAATLPAAGVPAAETGRFDGVVTDGTGIDTTGAGGYAAPIQAKPLVYGGYGFFSQGGAVKKPKGFQAGGIADADRRPLSPSDPLYITQDAELSGADARAELDTASSPRMARAKQMVARRMLEELSRGKPEGDAQLMQRLRDSSDIERAAYNQFGLEPGLDRASILPISGSREQGNLGFGAPAFLYDLAKAFVTPGTAVSGGRVSDEDALNFAASVAGGGAPLGISQALATPDGEALLGSFGSAIKQYPKLGRLADYLTDEEKTLFESPQWRSQAENVIETYQTLPPVREMANVARAGGAKKGWYEDSYNAIQDIFKNAERSDDPERFTALLAALSPQTSVESNLKNALSTWKNWLAAGRPTDQNQILKIMGDSVEGDKGIGSVLNAWKNNSYRALTAPDAKEMMGPVGLSGPKVQSFFRNLTGNFDEVTNDAWMAKLSSVNQEIFGGAERAKYVDDIGKIGIKGPGYLAQNAKQRQAAELLGWNPAQVQETSWSFGKTLSDLAGKPNYVIKSMEGAGIKVPEMYRGLPVQTAESALRGGYLTDEAIGGTPSFNDLLLMPGYRELLTGAGYALPARSTGTRSFTSPYDRINVGPEDLAKTREGRDLIMSSQRLDKMQRRSDAYSAIDAAVALSGKATTATEKRSAAQRLAQASRMLRRSASELPNVTVDTPYRTYLNK